MQRSSELFQEAKRYLPGGVDSPVRAFGSVGGHPFFVRKGSGSRLFDEDGNEYIDYVCAWGPLILGHAHARVVGAIKEAAERGLTFGAPTELETKRARVPSPGVPSSWVSDTLVARYNDLNSVERLFAHHDAQVAAVILEPVAA